VTQIVAAAGDRLDVIMLPKVDGPGTFITSISFWPSSKRATKSKSRS